MAVWEGWRQQHPQWEQHGKWLPQGAAACFALLAGSALIWLLPYQAAKADLAQLQRQETASKQAYVLQLRHAPQTERMQAGMRRAERRLILLKQQLTDSGEQEAVTNEIDTAGLARGLRFTLFKPEIEQKDQGQGQDRHGRIAVELRAIGTYQAITRFTDDIARLPRIVVLDPVTVEAVADTEGVSGLLALQATATAFQSEREQEHDDRNDDKD
jgi:type IV pilus assembly protein PilO